GEGREGWRSARQLLSSPSVRAADRAFAPLGSLDRRRHGPHGAAARIRGPGARDQLPGHPADRARSRAIRMCFSSVRYLQPVVKFVALKASPLISASPSRYFALVLLGSARRAESASPCWRSTLPSCAASSAARRCSSASGLLLVVRGAPRDAGVVG